MNIQDKTFVDNLQVILDLTQMLKYNVDSFKGNDIHKTVPKNRDMRTDCAALLNAINVFLIRLKQKCEPQTFNELMKIMSRDRLHDLSLHLNEMFDIDNIDEVTKIIIELKNEHKNAQQ